MTLIPYQADQFDRLALRFLDLAALFREIARRTRDERIEQVAVHDKKANEWIAKLEFWAEEARQRFELAAMRNLGAKKAKELLAENGTPNSE
ncbi:MAG: hypothetical protein DCC68_05570 [Planctomycetota bacterium]|nr:MAG: hypothetical protein DCC68_05570 [Planctomycetota bacterium]